MSLFFFSMLKALFFGKEKHAAQETENTAAADSGEHTETIPAPESAQETGSVTVDTLLASADECKAALLKADFDLQRGEGETGEAPASCRTREEIARYVDILSAMQTALRGLHPARDVRDLFLFLNTAFQVSLSMILCHGTSIECSKALRVVNNAIRAIPSEREDEIQIAALQLARLSQQCVILTQQRLIARKQAELDALNAAQRALLLQSGVTDAAQLRTDQMRAFDLNDQQIRDTAAYIETAQQRIGACQQEINLLDSHIEILHINPRALAAEEIAEQISALRSKLPTKKDLADTIDRIGERAVKTRAASVAQTNYLCETLKNNEYVWTMDVEQRASDMLQKTLEAAAKEAQHETSAHEAPRTSTHTPPAKTL